MERGNPASRRSGVRAFGISSIPNEALLKVYMGDEPYHYVWRQEPTPEQLQEFDQDFERYDVVDRCMFVCKLFKTWPKALATWVRRRESKKADAKNRVQKDKKKKYSRARNMLNKLRKRAAMLAIEDGTP